MIRRAGFTLLEEPATKGRPRCRRMTNGGMAVYTPSATQKAEKRVATAFTEQNPGWEPLAEGVTLHALFFTSQTRRGRPPDLDNLLKLVMDALNGLAWTDDAAVKQVMAQVYRHQRPEEVMTMVVVMGGPDAEPPNLV